MPVRGRPLTIDEYFEGRDPLSRQLFVAVRAAIESLGPVEVRATKSQIAFRRRVGFAWAWMPAQYLHGEVAPLVLTIDLKRRDPSPRWKEVVEPRPGRFTHHLELHDAAELDAEVIGWLREARTEAE